MTNTLAYYNTELITAAKSFVVHAPKGQHYKTFEEQTEMFVNILHLVSLRAYP